MVTVRLGLSILLVASVLMLAGVAPFCPPPGGAAMACCKPSAHCGRGMRPAGCCRVEEGRAPAPMPVLQLSTPRPQKWARAFGPLSSPADAPGGGARLVSAATLDRIAPVSPRLVHDSPTPLFLLTASILR